ncbi:MAG: hypothetical protein ACRD2S_02160 [Terriglobales bacterium]
MHNLMIHICTVCGREKTKSGWFLIAENRWGDKLKIVEWNDRVAWMNGVQQACSAPHALELVAHWMRTNSLDYPFERTHPFLKNQTRKDDPDISGVRQLGELYVDRESIRRVLDENPDSLTVILDELLFALQPDMVTCNRESAEAECDMEFAGSPS